MNSKIGFVGVGNMGSAILCGAVEKAGFAESDIYAHSLAFSDKVKKLNINVTSLKELVQKSDYIILCVKPNSFKEVLEEIKSVQGYGDKVYVSIAAGITIDFIKSILGDVKVIRTMPNISLLAGAGMTVIAPDGMVSEDEVDFAERIFSGAGKTLRISESLVDSCTAVSGSGPAYAFMFIEAMADAAVMQGISRKDAYMLSSQTLMGAALMQMQTGLNPAELKDMVCSPGGTTIEAVASLENDSFRASIINAVNACADKARRMKK
jgi:pyrroline-5-carboxylate reductase